MLAAGFEIDGDAENTQRWLRSADPATVSALRDRDEDMVRLLPRQFVAPGVFAGLDATPGSTQTLDNIAGLPPAVLTVMAVTPERVFVSLAPRSTATIWPNQARISNRHCRRYTDKNQHPETSRYPESIKSWQLH